MSVSRQDRHAILVRSIDLERKLSKNLENYDSILHKCENLEDDIVESFILQEDLSALYEIRETLIMGREYMRGALIELMGITDRIKSVNLPTKNKVQKIDDDESTEDSVSDVYELREQWRLTDNDRDLQFSTRKIFNDEVYMKPSTELEADFLKAIDLVEERINTGEIVEDLQNLRKQLAIVDKHKKA